MNVTPPRSPRERRPDDPGPTSQLALQTSPQLSTDRAGPLDPGQKAREAEADWPGLHHSWE